MRHSPPFPVTRDNFSSCWEAIDVMRRKSRRKAAISGIGGFWSNLVLLFSLLFIVNGLILSQFDGTYHAFLEDLPWFTDAWNYLAGLLKLADNSLTVVVPKLLLAVYFVSIAVFILLALPIVILYHPRKQPVPTGDYSEQTALLAKAAQEAQNYSYKTHISASFSSIILFIVAAVILFGAYAIHRNDPEPMYALLKQFPTGNQEANLIIYVYVCYIVCGALCEVLLLLTRPLYRYEFPYDYVVQAETAALFALEEDDEATPEKRMADAAALCEEAMEFEKESAYQKAKSMYFKAALGGDVRAMEHYARHCLIGRLNDSARYWLKRCVSSGQASQNARIMLLRMRLRMRHNARYLQPDAAPLTKIQKFRNAVMLILTILYWVLSFVLFTALVIFSIVLLKSNMDMSVFTDLSSVIQILIR